MWTGSGKLKDLDYLDGICLLAKNYAEMQNLTNRLAEDAAKIGLKINYGKTEIMNNFIPILMPISVDGVALKEVHKFTYLGCSIAKDGDVGNEIRIRIGKAGAAFRSMGRVLNDNNISLKTEIKLYDFMAASHRKVLRK